MQISELIGLLSEYREQYGDLEVVTNAFDYGNLEIDPTEIAVVNDNVDKVLRLGTK